MAKLICYFVLGLLAAIFLLAWLSDAGWNVIEQLGPGEPERSVELGEPMPPQKWRRFIPLKLEIVGGMIFVGLVVIGMSLIGASPLSDIWADFKDQFFNKNKSWH